MNPPLHPRIFYKHSLSLQKAGYQVQVIGLNSTPEQVEYFQNDIHCLALPHFDRSNFYARYQRRRKIQNIILSDKPDIVHLHTPELLPICAALKKQGIKVIYDVHENYAKNIRFAKYYPQYLKPFLLQYLRYCQSFVHKYVDAVIYAEQSYDNYLQFKSDRVFYVLNAYQPIEPAKSYELNFNPDTYELILLYTGNIAKEWGILNALKTWKLLQKRYKTALVIAGSGIFTDIPIHSDIYVYPHQNYLPYEHIVRLLTEMGKVKEKVLGLMLYEPLPNIMECLPTKWFEFVYYRIPILYTANTYWDNLNQRLDFGLSDLHIDSIQLPLVYYRRSSEWYEEYTWQNQQKVLVQAYASL
ncbi:MAG: glycosyltransferase [Bacteroidia bacterium]|nr:glycosyltransferase [Bacteroidia bacterium]